MREGIGLPVPRWMAEGRMQAPIDARDLRFEFHDVVRAAARLHVERWHKELKALFEGTGGWPMGVLFALRSQCVLSGPESYALLAEHIFSKQPERAQEFLLATCLLPFVDSAFCEAAGWTDAPEILDAMQGDAPFVFVTSERDVLQYHDALADYLKKALRKRGGGAI